MVYLYERPPWMVDGPPTSPHCTPGHEWLCCLSDMPPPAIVMMQPPGTFDKFPNVSSMTWLVNFLQREPVPHDGGWWLIEQRVEHLREGYSSCDMALWGKEVERGPVLVSRQMIAVYA